MNGPGKSPDERRHSSPNASFSSDISFANNSFAFSSPNFDPVHGHRPSIFQLNNRPKARVMFAQAQTTPITPLTEVLRRTAAFSSTHKLQDYEAERLERARALGLGDSPTKGPPGAGAGAGPGPFSSGSGPVRIPAPAPAPVSHTPVPVGAPSSCAFPGSRYSILGHHSHTVPSSPAQLSPFLPPPARHHYQQRPRPSGDVTTARTRPLYPNEEDYFYNSSSKKYSSSPPTMNPVNDGKLGEGASARGGPSRLDTGVATLRPAGQPIPPSRQPYGPGPTSQNFVALRSGVYVPTPAAASAGPASYVPPAARHLATLSSSSSARAATPTTSREAILRDSDDKFVQGLGPQVLATPAERPSRLARWHPNHPSHAAASTPEDPSRHFRPMEERRRWLAPIDEAIELMTKGFSPRYRGNPDLERNLSAPIPAHLNCSLFITGLAPTTTTAQLLGAIRDTGRVYATHINGPEPDRGHLTCAAKIVFFERAAAERFFHRFQLAGFSVAAHPRYVGRVVWNRIRSAEVDVGGRKSRVLLISGPPALVNEVALRSYLAGKIQFQVESIRTLNLTTARSSMASASGFDQVAAALAAANAEPQRALVEFRFGSYRCQAEAARMALNREFKEYGVFCEFGKDPCDLELRQSFW
ncbi:hypothetical protein B0T16DRAFT_447320 [Cercophora newfieldiana]|uniref:RRM domain-containing protein n=1 Tax=Cercophora newfieldiana TaxID=92897 RepID=A0AA39Y1W5_9PEZI|nr:hypothetical protein B0T16DRAFT_447320 [Cercophora newfieldiana]